MFGVCHKYCENVVNLQSRRKPLRFYCAPVNLVRFSECKFQFKMPLLFRTNDYYFMGRKMCRQLNIFIQREEEKKQRKKYGKSSVMHLTAVQ